MLPFNDSSVGGWNLPFTVVPTAIGTAMDVNLSNASLVFMSVTFATMCKSAAPIFLLLFAFAFRFKLIFGYLQLDNQLPLTLMHVLLAPEQSPDVQHPVFKMTITMQNENKDGIQVYPYVYIRVTEKCWRLDIHEPIIWAIVDFYNNLQLDRLPKSSTVTEVDPEIRFDGNWDRFLIHGGQK